MISLRATSRRCRSASVDPRSGVRTGTAWAVVTRRSRSMSACRFGLAVEPGLRYAWCAGDGFERDRLRVGVAARRTRTGPAAGCTPPRPQRSPRRRAQLAAAAAHAAPAARYQRYRARTACWNPETRAATPPTPPQRTHRRGRQKPRGSLISQPQIPAGPRPLLRDLNYPAPHVPAQSPPDRSPLSTTPSTRICGRSNRTDTTSRAIEALNHPAPHKSAKAPPC